MRRIFNLPICLLTLLLLSGVAASVVYAGSGSNVPNTFSSGSTAKAGEVNVNFDYLEARCWDWDVNRNRLFFVDGNVGIGTSIPDNKLVINNKGSTYALQISEYGEAFDDGLLLYTNSSGAIISTNNAIPLIFSIDTTEEMRIDSAGNVGIGTSSPSYNLHVYESGDLNSYFEATGTVDVVLKGESQAGVTIKSNTDPFLNFQVGTTDPGSTLAGIYVDSTDYSMSFMTGSVTDRMILDSSGNLGIGTTAPNGKLDVRGSIYQRGASLHADYVFEDNYRLESIDEHTEYMWKNKHLKAIPKAIKDEDGMEILEVGSHQKGIVEELEKAHIYISQLNGIIKREQEKMNRYEKTILELSEKVDMLSEKVNALVEQKQ